MDDRGKGATGNEHGYILYSTRVKYVQCTSRSSGREDEKNYDLWYMLARRRKSPGSRFLRALSQSRCIKTRDARERQTDDAKRFYVWRTYAYLPMLKVKARVLSFIHILTITGKTEIRFVYRISESRRLEGANAISFPGALRSARLRNFSS